MLSLFPSLLALEGFAPFLLRLTLSAVFLVWAAQKRKGGSRDKQIAVLDLIVGILLIIGYLTQLAALVASIMLAVGLVKKIKNKKFLTDGVNYYLILLIIAITLLLTGPGFIAFDLPL
jgi:uncharacterized membrane protein YphA (DoxX/SURF4 family)